MQWWTDEPPINTEIEYERDNGVAAPGKLAYGGEFGQTLASVGSAVGFTNP